MEVINSQENKKPPVRRRHDVGTWLIAIIFIAVGLIWVGYNTGVISREFFRIVVSWQMLLIVLGTSLLFRRQESVVGGAVMIGIGAFFMVPKFTGWVSMGTYWPLVFVVVGIVILVSLLATGGCRRKCGNR